MKCKGLTLLKEHLDEVVAIALRSEHAGAARVSIIRLMGGRVVELQEIDKVLHDNGHPPLSVLVDKPVMRRRSHGLPWFSHRSRVARKEVA